MSEITVPKVCGNCQHFLEVSGHKGLCDISKNTVLISWECGIDSWTPFGAKPEESEAEDD